ncbi:Thymidylate kinase/adenylate kinase [Fasciola hepatica]|uniref:dTMP kinase n=1 Tax=Fasciola hepatica TaxID=6192 RepID=A0A4E0QYT9_FASHE|nr:Thymidylate kinase/adenylate kinase [Fasciola hepatica]
MGAGRGVFVVFEGSEKGGKKTQSKLLADALTQISGKKTLHIHFPDKSTSTGRIITRYLTHEINLAPRAAHLLFTANRWERQTEIAAALDEGRHVVVDRYSYSGIVYTAAQSDQVSEVDWTWCCTTESGLIKPDVIFCLTPGEMIEIAARDGFGQRPSETASFQTRVLTYYSRLSREMENELTAVANEVDATVTGDTEAPSCSKPKLWNWIQATGQTIDEIHTCIMTILDPLL